MCLRPIFISNPKSGNLQRLPAVERGKYFLPSLSGFYVPCGKCLECLHRKQLSRVPQYVRELSLHSSNVFVTLTYRNDTLPLALCVQDWIDCVDSDTGELYRECHNDVTYVLDSSLRSDMVGLFGYSLTGSVKSKRIVSPFGDSETWRLTPSLRRKDVSLFIKRNRVRFQRMGRPLDFKFICVGEYGPRTSRPHYHLLVCGMDFSTAKEFFSPWSEDFGNVNIKPIEHYTRKDNGEVVNGFVAVSYYVSKYMSKGCFECDCAKYHWSESPRTVVSVGFGCELTSEEEEYFSPSSFTSSDIELICNRSYYLIDGVKYPLPPSWKRRLRYELVISTTFNIYEQKIVPSYRYTPNPLQVACSDFVRTRFNELAFRKLFQGQDVEASRLSLSDFMSLVSDENVSTFTKEEYRFAKLREFYAKSVF